jgi:lysozyme
MIASEIKTIVQGTTTQLEIDEGFRPTPYQCSAGVWTFGHGLTYITQYESLRIVEDRVQELYWLLSASHKWFNDLTPARKSVILNMAYNLGYRGLLGFKKMIAAIERGDYDEAKRQMLYSKWARQVGDRAIRLANQMSKW